MQNDTSTRRGEGSPLRAVTFLFTDVEGSTALLRRLGARAYAGALGSHDRILREAVSANGGSLVDTQGDAIFAAFSDAGAAVQAAVSAQLRLAGEPWPEGESLRVRMGLHTGEPEMADGRYLGLDVHLAARICAAAHGGQVVISEAVNERLAHGGRTHTHALGAHPLKDFETPVELFQVDSAEMTRFPPLRARSPDSDVGRFEGREDELAEAAAETIARAARRSERRRWLTAFGVVVIISAAVLGYVVTRPHRVHVAPDSVAVIDAVNGAVKADVPVGRSPTSIAAGPGGVWALDTAGNTLARISPGRPPQSQGLQHGQGTDVVAATGSLGGERVRPHRHHSRRRQR